MTEAIAVSGLRKSYGKTVALDGLDLSVAEGEVHGFLGPNGAGKTTTIRILLGLLRPDGGTARLLGGDPWREATALHRRLAYVPGDVTLWPNLSGGEVIDLLGRLRGRLDAKRRARLLERFDLDPTKKARTYSKGNRQKVALISALASDVELLLLDEPTSRARPADGGGVPGVHRGGTAGRPHRPALQPHPVRGGGAVRAGHDHPGRPDGGVRGPGRPAPSHPDLDLRRPGGRPPPGSRSCPACTTSTCRSSAATAARVRCEVDTDKLDGVLRQLTARGCAA